MTEPSWLRVLAHLGPMALAFTPLAPIAPIVIAAIAEAEAMQGATGPEKLAHVVNIATDAASATNLQTGKPVIDPALMAKTASEAISTTVDVVKMVNDAHTVLTPPTPVTPVPPFV